MIKANNIRKSYGELEVLKGVNIHINEGEIVAIVGASGAGKTTLLQILGTLEQPSNKDAIIEINNKNVPLLNTKELAAFRNKNIGFIFQFHQLLPEFTAIENVCIPAYIHGASKEQATKDATELLSFLGLLDRIHHKPDALSGGEQQRVAVARALINKPAVVFADEPSGNLDSESAQVLHQLFFKLRDTYNQTFVLVTHNELLAKMADRTFTMVDGHMVQ
jgi:lipoprotein-releasing system ATP-binding protein